MWESNNADINTNILNGDFNTYKPKDFDVIWASPPYTEYNKTMTRRTRNINAANEIVLKSLKIIDYLNPTYYIVKNPQTGLWTEQLVMNENLYNDI